MPDPRFSRRTFVIGGGLSALAAACSGGGSGTDAGGTSTTLGQADKPIQGGAAARDLYTGTEIRLPFGVLRNSEEGAVLVTGDPVTIGFRGPEGETIAPMTTTFRGAGLDTGAQHEHADGAAHVHEFEHKGIYVVHTTFPAAGFWTADLDVGGQPGEFVFEVFTAPQVPSVGEPAPTAASPTTADPLDVDPLCTRDPVCPLHEVSLNEAIGRGTPVVAMFATPARCQSRWCGPVLELLLDARDGYRDQATFVHVEIYRDLQSNDLVPTLEAWDLESEPWLFAIDGGGMIVDRLEGAFDGDEVDAVLAGLTT